MNNTSGFTRFYLVLAVFVAVLGGFLFGYDSLVISGTLDYLAAYFKLNAWGIGFAASVAQLGGLAGALGGGWIADRVGLKRSLYLCAILFIASAIGIYFARSVNIYTFWRLICGLSSGISTIVAPMYVAEISPARVRGGLVTLFQLGLVFGIFSAILVNSCIHRMGDEQWNAAVGWRWMFLAGSVPGILFFFSVVAALESPRWLMKVKREHEALEILERLNGKEQTPAIASEIQEALNREPGKIRELFTGPFRKPLIIGMALAALSQASGINVMLVYLPEIFKAAGSNATVAFSQAVMVGLVNILFSVAALWLIDRAGRRSLILAGTAIQFISLAAVGVMYFLSVKGLWMAALLMAAIAGHAIGNGAACWVVISEIFPTKIRGRAMSFSITAMWVAGYVFLLVFPVMRKNLSDGGTFWCFALAALANHLYARFEVPETKGYSLEKIEAMWRARHADTSIASLNIGK
jgi:SP family arabinose:H+ symporter-like MFS transporter